MSEPLSINIPDKVLAGLNQSYTITSEVGEPSGKVTVGGTEVPHRVIRLGPPKTWDGNGTPQMKYKVSFLLPADSTGKKMELRFEAGGATAEVGEEIKAE